MTAASFSRLSTPLRIGRSTMRNRVLLAPMSVGYANRDGGATRAMAEHYGRRAQGGIGMVITENVAVNVAGRQMPLQPMLADPAAVPGFAAVASEIRRHGALAAMQIVHAGRYAGPWDVYEQARRLAPSAVAFPLTPGRVAMPAEMTLAEIEASVAAFANTAKLAQDAGFDGVELHAAQGFLISSFLSPRMNRRADRYGGDFAGRTRLLHEVLQAVRAAVAADFIVGLHLTSDELAAGGWTLADAVRLVGELGSAGLDFVMPIVATFETMRMPENDGLMGHPVFQHAQARAIKAATTLPVFTNGGISDPALIERILADEEADAVGLARPLFADPDWLEKVRDGSDIAVRRCGCETQLCLRTQLTGSQCQSWPEAVRARGFLGYGA